MADNVVGSAFYELNARDQALLDAFRRAEGGFAEVGDAADSFGDEVEQAADRSGDALQKTGGFADRLKGKLADISQGVLQGMGQAVFQELKSFATGALDAMITGASDLNENLSKSQAVFGGFAADISAWASDAPMKLASTQSAAIGAASSFGNLFVAMKLGQQPAAEMSTALVELATDLASFNNVTVEEALDSLRSGLVGQTEPMRKFGVMIDEATIKAKALELGLIATVKSGLTPAAKAQATYALILEQTAVAQGDFARTSSGFANQSRILSASIADGMAKIGARILPLIASVLPPLIEGLTAVFDIFGKVADVAGPILGAAFDALRGPAQAVFDLAKGIATELKDELAVARELIALAGQFADQEEGSGGADPFNWIVAQGAAAHDEIVRLFGGVGNDTLAAMAAAEAAAAGAATQAFIAAERAAESSGRAIGGSWASVGQQVQSDLNAIPGQAFNVFAEIGANVEEEGRRLPRHFADGILAARQAPLDAMDTLKALMKASLSETAQTTRLLGQLASDELAKGMIDKDPAVRNAAREERNSAINQLMDLGVTPGTLSAKGMAALIAAMKSADPIVAAAATTIFNSTKAAVPTPVEMDRWAKASMNAYALAIRGMQGEVTESVQHMLAGAVGTLRAFSPPKQGPLRDIARWAKATGLAWVEAFVDAIGSADELVKLKLGGVQARLEGFLKSYGGIGGQLPGGTPGAQSAQAKAEIARLSGELAGTSDPAARASLLSQIAALQGQINELRGQTSRPEEVAIDTLRGYVDKLDRALLTEQDPAKRKELIDKISEYLLRIDEMNARMGAQDEILAQTAEADKQARVERLQAGIDARQGDPIALGGGTILPGYAPPDTAAVARAMAPPNNVTFNAPLLWIASFTGTDADVDRLMDKIGERLRELLPAAAWGAGAAP